MKKIVRLSIFLLGLSLLFIVGFFVFALRDNLFSSSSEATVGGHSLLVSFIERKLSAPNRQIRLHNVRGMMSSRASIGSITVSDNEGIWLEITGAKIDWSRLALLKGRIEIDELLIEHVTFSRKPRSSSSGFSFEAGQFSVPKLPVAISVNALTVEHVAFKDDLFGLPADLSLKGHVILASDKFDADIAAHRLDAPGRFSFLTKISNDKRTAKINIATDEPENGILAHILGVKKYPAVNLAVKGDGTFDDLFITLRLEADRRPILDGDVAFAGTSEGYNFSSKLVGAVGLLVPSQYRGLFGSDAALKIEGIITKEGAVRLDDIIIQDKAINVVAKAETTADGFLRRLFVDGKAIFDEENESACFPLLGKKTCVGSIALNIDYGREGQQAWKGKLIIHHLGNETVHISDAVFDMGGSSENLDNLASRHVGIQVDGLLQGITSTKDVLTGDLGQTVHVHLDTDIASGKPTLVRDFSIMAQDFSLWLKGKIDHFVFKGDLGLNAKELKLLGMLSGQPLSGGANFKANGVISLVGSIFDLELSGTADNAKIGIETVDYLLKGNLTFSGGAAKNTKNLIVRHLHLRNQHTDIKANGRFSNKNVKMDFRAQMFDLAMLDSRMSGAATIQGAARGHNNVIMISTRLHIAEAFLVGNKLQNTVLNINALLNNTSPVSPYVTGSAEGKGIFAKKPLQLSVSFNNSDQMWKIRGLNIKGGDAKVIGDFSQTLGGYVKGALHIDANDISALAALFLQEGTGKVMGDFVFEEQNGRQKANLKAHIDHLVLAENEVKKLAIQADISDLFGPVQFEGFANAEHIQTPWMVVNHLNAHANSDDGRTSFDVQARVHDDINAQFSGHLVTMGSPAGVKQKILLETMDVKQSNFRGTLLKPATIIVGEDGVSISELGLSVNEGKIVLMGNIHDSLDLHLTMSAAPFALANLWKSDLGADGTLTGKIMIRGSLEKPNVVYDVKGQGLKVAALQEKNITPLALSATGQMVDKILSVHADFTGEELQAQTQGTITLDENKIGINVDLQNFPARLVNSFIRGQALGGTMAGKINIGGKLKDLSAHFELFGRTMTVITHNGPVPVNMNVNGFYEKSMFHIERATATGPKELNLSVNGHISLNNPEIGLNIKGTMPLTFVDPFLAERGAQVTGVAKIDATLDGILLKPKLIGSLSVINGSFFDSQTNLGLSNITLEGKLDGDYIILKRASARSFGGGAVSASGRISDDLQADLVIHLDHANYNDGSTIFATLTGTATVTGHFLHDIIIGGDVTVEKAEIFVPDHFQGSTLLDVKHKHLTKPIEETLERTYFDIYSRTHDTPEESPSALRLNMRINAHNKFFVRGRGLDAELGGRISLTGSWRDVRPVGELQMIRGRFDILSQRLDFDQGQVSFSGNFNPTVYFVANSNSGDISVAVTLSGTIHNLDVNFSSQPVLPQDEVLARLIFKRSLSELSPFQIAQLVAAAAELAGATNTSLLEALRSKIGLDDLDVIVNENGKTGLRVGRYIRDNIYFGFEAGSDGTTKGTINLDISRHLKAKGAIGNEKNSSFGIFYEKDY
ncbi:hypothetical protein BAnh1_00400 [Bartonella australis AUST/NH1]|uniref:Translocation and assembly module TamB C-terminal domain-containing protein n=1 Tax=Bartonella australis (strain Aust/NH1) TaxID=1094489 RepID=M1NRH1_BARAA|nr:translocation/assembly module TamB domain-containing protein [Bartonella australis]AGF73933.1 hypothetical protein BAnh1_00400 [Bartonella australis AUST/NH1]